MPELVEEHVLSYGGGVQSTALLALQAEGVINYSAFLFANVGEDSENPETIDYLNNVAIPFADKHGIRFIVGNATFGGEPDSVLRGQLRRKRSALIPGFVQGGGMLTRSCTYSYKIVVVNKMIRDLGINKAHIGIGFSTDEMRRVTEPTWTEVYKRPPLQTIREYPLIDLNISRANCYSIIKNAGLPEPPKSACWFCPFLSRSEWIEMKKHHPDRFQAAIDLENKINEARKNAGSKPIFLHRSKLPLADAVPDQLSMFDILDDDLNCGTGYCGL